MRDLGAMGESFFAYICATVGLVANGSKIDKTGWDYFVEFPLNANINSNADLIPTPISCRIQVKATDKNNKKIQIKISNLLTLAKAHTPSFIFFLEFNGKNEPQGTYLVHLNHQMIFSILKRARELSVLNQGGELHKKTMTIHYDNSHKLDENTGLSLKKMIENYVNRRYEKYVYDKIKYLKNAGYERSVASISFKVNTISDLCDLIDSSLGLKKSGRITDFSVSDTRFGIKTNSHIIKEKKGVLSFNGTGHVSEGKIIFIEDKFSSPLIFNCRLYSSPFNFFVKKELIKIKIEGEFFIITINPFTGKVTYSFNYNSVFMPLYKFRNAFLLMELLFSGDKKVKVRTEFDDFPEMVFDIKCHDEKTTWVKNIQSFNDMIYLSQRFNIPSDAQTTIDYVLENHAEFSKISQLLQANEKDINLSFMLTDSESRPITVDSEYLCVINTIRFDFLGRSIVIIMLFYGYASQGNENRINFEVHRKSIEKEFSFINNEITNEDIQELIENIFDLHKNNGIKVVVLTK
ncbi:hypothetical protein ACRQTN_03835 [Pectobacterium brasiliense]|uniref:hypothetical protein n=1 Tax=Pectobacterium TaxID=122277 RepID=UPI00381D89A4